MGRVFGAAVIWASLWPVPVVGADIAIDVASGEILTATDADSPRFPASLTKLMTAYVAFEALAAGDMTTGQLISVSHFAARRPPVKLGLSVGAELPFSEILDAAVVGSKNDAAVAVAEAVSETESAFVARMNEAAQRLGMTNTAFANATGLPAPGQRTTARDIALLSRALLSQFPKRSALFSQRSVQAAGQRVGTTNPLFGRVLGAEGLKTGFTCAAGYAISALVERDGRRIVAVTLGHPTKAKRLKAVKGLINAAFQLSGSGEVLKSAPVTASLPRDVRACSGAAVDVVSTDLPPEELALYAAELAKAKRRLAIKNRQKSQPKQLSQPKTVTIPKARNTPPPPSGWAILLGAYRTEKEARSTTRMLRLRIGERGVDYIERRQRDGWSLALMHSLNRHEAAAICRETQRYCVVLPPARLLNKKAQWRR